MKIYFAGMAKQFPMLLLLLSMVLRSKAQEISLIVQQAKKKIEKVNDYEASGKMKTNVAFLKIPVASVKVYFKRPNRLKIKSEKGISFIPKGAVSINMSNTLNDDDYTIIDAGAGKIGNTPVRIARLLPNDDNSEVVLSTLYIDPVNNLILKARTTTKDNGTYELEMTYAKYSEYALPDKIVFSFNTKDYKLPKGVTFDFDDGSERKKPVDNIKNKKGRAEITFNVYSINKGVPDSVFE